MLLKVSEVCALLRLSRPTIHQMCKLGTLRAVKLGPRGTRISQESIDEYLRNTSHGEVNLGSTNVRR